jgi:hypothetical protein
MWKRPRPGYILPARCIHDNERHSTSVKRHFFCGSSMRAWNMPVLSQPHCGMAAAPDSYNSCRPTGTPAVQFMPTLPHDASQQKLSITIARPVRSSSAPMTDFCAFAWLLGAWGPIDPSLKLSRYKPWHRRFDRSKRTVTNWAGRVPQQAFQRFLDK